MNDIRVVDFQGDELTVVKMFDDNKIYVSIRNVCRSLGLDENRTRSQRIKVSTDPVLIRGKRNIGIPTNGGVQEMLCLDIDFLPIWLTKINANILDEDVKNKLVEYQLRAKEVLSRVFVHNEVVSAQNKVMPFDMDRLSPETQALVMLVNSIASTQLEQKRQAEEITSVKKDIQNIREVYTITSSDDSWRQRTNSILNNICRNIGDYRTPKEEIYEKLNQRARCNIELRTVRMQERAMLNGMAQSRATQISKLDAIAADNRLKEIYIQIVKEFAIFHGYDPEDVESI